MRTSENFSINTSKIASVNKGFALPLIIFLVAITFALVAIVLFGSYFRQSQSQNKLTKINATNPTSNAFDFKNSAAFIQEENIKNPKTGYLDTKYKLFLVDIETGTIKEVSSLENFINKIEFSPDKSKLAYNSNLGKDIYLLEEETLKPAKLDIQMYSSDDKYYGTVINFISWAKDGSQILYQSNINKDFYECNQRSCDEAKRVENKYLKTKTDLKIKEGLFAYNIYSKQPMYLGEKIPTTDIKNNLSVSSNEKVISFDQSKSVLEGTGDFILKDKKTNKELKILENAFAPKHISLSKDGKKVIVNYTQRGQPRKDYSFPATNYGLLTIDLNTLEKKYLTKGQVVSDFAY